IAAGEMRIAEEPGHRMPVERLGHVLLLDRTGVVAGRELLARTEIAAATGDGEGHHHPLSYLKRALRPDFDHAPHELMPEDVPGQHSGDHPVIEMQVRAADCGGGDLDHRIARLDDARVGYRFHPDVVG